MTLASMPRPDNFNPPALQQAGTPEDIGRATLLAIPTPENVTGAQENFTMDFKICSIEFHDFR
jgi:hypothetical protein